jgi:hypothetical protein
MFFAGCPEAKVNAASRPVSNSPVVDDSSLPVVVVLSFRSVQDLDIGI